MASQPRRRVRTGCLKCRVRRRKCDEGKPKCQRCIASGFDCQYGVRLSFLDKNAFTLDSAAPVSELSPARTNHPPIQFIGAYSPKSSSIIEPCDLKSPSQQPEESGAPRNADPTHTDLSLQVDESMDFAASSILWTDIQGQSPSVLQAPQIADPALADTERGLDGRGRADASLSDLVRAADIFRDREEQLAIPTEPIADEQLSDDDVLKFFAYYRYEVAPALDICDLGQAFGISLLDLATKSASVFQSVLSLARTARNADPRISKDLLLLQRAPSSLSRFDYFTPRDEHSLLCQSLIQAESHFEDGAIDHIHQEKSPELTTAMLEAASASPIFGAVYYFRLRLDLSTSLIHETPLREVPRPPEQFSYPWQQTPLAHTVFHYANTALALTCWAANLCWGKTAPHGSGGGGPTAPPHLQGAGGLVGSWTSLVDDLRSWYRLRPQEFMPMVDFEMANDTTFPTILFTSGAAVFGNQMYHTAMFLLLRHKPRTAQISSSSTSSTSSSDPRRAVDSSPLWHARRVCGIALNNDRRESWDMSLVSSLLAVAKSMTHETQHQAILEALDQIGEMTGFRVGSIRDTLKEEWGT
ncbi:hypothetical protein BX600DRAFT_518899 [Xylariales sp. PMI_506]|nr:hypothetical protein BX600DRAFT_518899 [Xylariales sp. PMI_506]